MNDLSNPPSPETSKMLVEIRNLAQLAQNVNSGLEAQQVKTPSNLMNITQEIDLSVNSSNMTDMSVLNRTNMGFNINASSDVASQYVSNSGPSTSQHTVPNTADSTSAGPYGLTRSELIVLQSIVQGSKIKKVTSNIRHPSRYRSKKRNRSRYRQSAGQTRDVFGAYKESPMDLTSSKNFTFKRTLANLPKSSVGTHGKRNLTSKLTVEQSKMNTRIYDVDIKVKKYIEMLMDQKSEFDDLISDAELYDNIISQILLKPEFKKFV